MRLARLADSEYLGRGDATRDPAEMDHFNRSSQVFNGLNGLLAAASSTPLAPISGLMQVAVGFAFAFNAGREGFFSPERGVALGGAAVQSVTLGALAAFMPAIGIPANMLAAAKDATDLGLSLVTPNEVPGSAACKDSPA